MKKNLIKITIFLLIGILLFGGFVSVFRFKYAKILEKYYTLPEQTVDVLFVGSSHVYRNINPAVMFREEGIAGYDLGSASQPIWNSYYYIEEALKTQSPKVIVLDCYRIDLKEDYFSAATTIKATTGMHLSGTFIQAVNASVDDPKDRIDYYLKFPWYHARYGELSREDFKANYDDDYYRFFLGYMPLYQIVTEEIPSDVTKVTEKGTFSEKTQLYLDKIVALAEENDIPLLFVLTPFCERAEEKQPFYNTLADYAAKNDVPFLNCNILYDEIGMDGASDFSTKNHLSYSGAEKCSLYLASYLKENYALEDHRGDSAYQRWQENVDYFEEHSIQEMESQAETDTVE
jgi:hypothetical protein